MDTGWDRLTPREWDVVRLVADGLTDKQVAARLVVSLRTVQNHLTNYIYPKLGFWNRASLVAGYISYREAQSRGLVHIPVKTWERWLDHAMHDYTSYSPEDAAWWGAHCGADLDTLLRSTPSRDLRKEFEHLAGLAHLTRAWGLMNSRHTHDLDEVTTLARQTMADYHNEELVVLGTTIIGCASRIRLGSLDTLDTLESLKSRAATCRPIVALFFYEELAREHTLSDEHSLDTVRTDLAGC